MNCAPYPAARPSYEPGRRLRRVEVVLPDGDRLVIALLILKIPGTEGHLRVVALESRRLAAHEPVCLPGLVDVAA